jgi:hypothetical protein
VEDVEPLGGQEGGGFDMQLLDGYYGDVSRRRVKLKPWYPVSVS